jgi:hypothetical protein
MMLYLCASFGRWTVLWDSRCPDQDRKKSNKEVEAETANNQEGDQKDEIAAVTVGSKALEQRVVQQKLNTETDVSFSL